MEFIKQEKKENYALVAIDRPQALNALHLELLRELEATLIKLENDTSIHVAVIYSTSARAFAAGADVAAMQKMDVQRRIEFCRAGRAIMERIAELELITIAAIQGFALGGGLELALACDLRLAASTAQMGLPEVSLGIIPGFGGSQRLPRLIASGVALEMMMSGQHITAARAFQIGLVNQIYADDGFLEAVQEYVRSTLTAKNSIRAQLAVQQALRADSEVDLNRALQTEDAILSALLKSDDAQEGFTAFIEKRKAKFGDRAVKKALPKK